MGLTRQARMTRADFRMTKGRRGHRVPVGPLVLQVVHMSHDVDTGPPVGRGPVRVGLVVGRRVGGAVQRNRVRRRLRAAAARVLEQSDPVGPNESGCDAHSVGQETLVVVRAQPGIATMTVDEMSRAIDRGLRRVLAASSRRTR